MPMSIVGGHGGSYRKVNPQLAQTVESLKTICSSMNRARDQWWLSGFVNEQVQANGDGTKQKTCGNDEESDEEELVDLQSGYQQSPVMEESSVVDEGEGGDSDWE